MGCEETKWLIRNANSILEMKVLLNNPVNTEMLKPHRTRPPWDRMKNEYDTKTNLNVRICDIMTNLTLSLLWWSKGTNNAFATVDFYHTCFVYVPYDKNVMAFYNFHARWLKN